MVQLTIDFTLGCAEQTWAEAQICLAQAVVQGSKFCSGYVSQGILRQGQVERRKGDGGLSGLMTFLILKTCPTLHQETRCKEDLEQSPSGQTLGS